MTRVETEVAPARGPTRASREALRGSAPAESASPAAPPRVALTIRAVDAPLAEDGRGGLVTARAPVALELRREDGWPGRALNPVLYVGELRFEHYEHVDPLVLRYVAADGAALPRDADAFVQWGDDAASRVDVVRAPLGGPAGDVRP